MAAFRVLLIAMLAVIAGYTAIVVAHDGMNFFPAFNADLRAMAWPGQFNLDFSCFLLLSGLWVAWRHHFSATGLGLAVLAFFGGMVFLASYLLVVSFQTGGDIKAVLLGRQRAAG
ncbi:hypothetical protein BH10PSE14_BH10PSE14_19760 [soil metagenome]